IAFGQILPRSVLDVPKRGSINVHASLLPRYRGAAPIAWAIMRGETETGITTMQMDEGMDTGAMLLRAPTPIGADETAGELSERLAALGAEVLIETLARLDRLTPVPQRHEEATLAPRLTKTDGDLDWARPACSSASSPREPTRISPSTVSSTAEGCRRGTSPWPPSSCTGRCAGSATSTGSSPRTPGVGWTISTSGCSSSCA